jgi:hypothetical protein
MLATITPSYRGAGQANGLIELRDEVLMMKESPTAHSSSVFVGVVALQPPDEMICCERTVPARPWIGGRAGIDMGSQLPNT